LDVSRDFIKRYHIEILHAVPKEGSACPIVLNKNALRRSLLRFDFMRASLGSAVFGWASSLRTKYKSSVLFPMGYTVKKVG
jgi:hypothetical protein